MKAIIFSILLSLICIIFSIIGCIISPQSMTFSIILFTLAFICMVAGIIILVKGNKK